MNAGGLVTAAACCSRVGCIQPVDNCGRSVSLVVPQVKAHHYSCRSGRVWKAICWLRATVVAHSAQRRIFGLPRRKRES